MTPKDQLTVAIAKGELVTQWARAHHVPRRTAFRWARDPKVRTAVEKYRRRVLDRAVGRMTGGVTLATTGIQRRVDDGTMKVGCLIAPTAADIRDVMVEGQSGLIAVAPPWNRPWFESSKRRVEWPNGARAICLSGEEPERARGLNIDTLWADELACWRRAQSTWDLVMLSLRAGTNPQALITTTPRRLAVLRRILTETTTVQTTDSTDA